MKNINNSLVWNTLIDTETEDCLSQYHLSVPDFKDNQLQKRCVKHHRTARNWKHLTQEQKQKQYGRHSEKMSHVLFERECAEAEEMEM